MPRLPRAVVPRELTAGAREIRGQIRRTEGQWHPVSANVWLVGSAGHRRELMSDVLFDHSRGTFLVTLAEPARAGDRLVISLTGPRGEEGPASAEVETLAASAGDARPKAVPAEGPAPAASAATARLVANLHAKSTEAEGYYTGEPAPSLLELCKGAPGSACEVVGGTTVTWNHQLGQFKVVWPKATQLAVGDVVKVRLGTGADWSAPVTVASAPAWSAPQRLALAALMGASSVEAQFDPVTNPAVEATARLAPAEGPALERKLTTAELNAGKAKLDLGRLVAPAESMELTLTYSSASLDVKNAVVTLKGAEAKAAAILINPIKEGDMSVKGQVAASVRRVRIAALAFAFSPAQAQRKIDVAKALESKTTEGQAGGRTATPKLFASTMSEVVLGIVQKHVSQISASVLARDAVANVAGDILEEVDVRIPQGETSFEATFTMPLAAGTKILAREMFTDPLTGPLVATDGPAPLAVAPSGRDWGRARFYLMTGAAISASRESLGKTDPFLSFTMDTNLALNMLERPCLVSGGETNRAACKSNSATRPFELRRFGAAIHQFFEARLAQTGTVPALTSPTAALQPVQSALVQTGVYAPMRLTGMDWVRSGQQYSFFFAPLLKAGVTVVNDGVEYQRSTKKTVLPNLPAGARQPEDVVTIDNRKFGAPFYGGGLRVGLNRYELMGNERRNRQLLADQQMYIDVTWGRNHIYRTPRNPEINSDGAGTTITTIATQMRRRFAVEARMKLPYLPAMLGFDYNANITRPGSGPTDFRMFVGVRVDMMKFLNATLPKK